MKLRSGDTVLVVRGRDRGKQGQIQRVFPRGDKVLVEGVNIVKRHTKASANVRQAGIIQKELPMPVSNVVLVCPHSNNPTRVGFRILADGTKARICKDCQEVIE
jgi:large subunit ribosomal protein L24